MNLARRVALAALVAISALSAIAPAASADRTFSLRYQTIDRADSVFVANTLMTCGGPGCNAVRNGTDTSQGNGDFTEQNVNTDSDATTFSSSSANLTLPAGAVVQFAGLYWGADTTAGVNGSAAPAPASNGTMKFRAGAGAYQNITASVIDTDSQRTSRYQAFADVTSIVASGGGAPTTYWGANVQAGTGEDRYAGWALAVVYQDPAKGIQQVGVYDGLTSLVAATRPSVSIPLDSFLTPASGTVNAKVGLVAWEGDNDISSETATLNGTTLTDAVNGATNQFNSTISRNGAHVTTKSPNYVNQLGIDADQVTANGFIPNSSTSTTLALGTSQDTYLPGVVTLVNDTYLISPANTGAPSITGTATDRSVLTANPGTWTGSPAPTFTYQWRRCDASGNNCADIGGATASTYTQVVADIGSTIRVVVTGTNAGGTATATSPQTAVVTALAPFVVTPPAVTGTAQDAQVLSLSQGTWDGSPTITYAYSWQRCNAGGASCVAIGGQTATTYTLTPGDVGFTIRGVVTATNGGGSTPSTTTQTAVVTARPPVNTVVPALSGTAREGLTLTTGTGTWTGTPTIAYTYQWQRCNAGGGSCADIGGATNATYTAVTADVGNTLRARVTGTNAAGNASAVTLVSAIVAAAPPVNTVVPVVTGTARDGQTLSATTGTWTGTPTIAFTYQWQRCSSLGAGCVNIGGATNPTYVLTSAEVAGTVRVVVTGTNTAGNSTGASVVTAVVLPTLPVNTALPTITGTLTEGSTVTGQVGTWTGTPTITYAHQWRRCNSGGGSCADIPGATSPTYTLVAADVGESLRIVVTATNGAGSTAATSNFAGGNPAALVNTALPTITGTPRDGQTLTASNGTWSGSAPTGYAYQWQRCDTLGANCTIIGGQTAQTLTLTPADVGFTIRVRVTATNGAGSAQATSLQTAVVAADPPANTALPVVSGTARDGQVLSSTTGTWTGTPTISYARQWLRCDSGGGSCTDIPAATGLTYTLTPADVDATIRVRVTGTNLGGSADATSAATALVVPDPPANTVPPVITGTARDGQTLSATTGTWTGTPTISYAYQWRRCDSGGGACADITDATAATYTLTPADVDGTIRVRVTATNAGGSAFASSLATTAVLPDPPVNTVLPVISGTVRDGQTLTSDTGTWTGTPAIAYARQWLRCDGGGGSCGDIPSATGATYTLTPADVDSTIRLRVTATNAGGSAFVSSAATTAVLPDPPVNTVLPVISGTVRDGQTLSADDGTWTGTPVIAYTHQWSRCDSGGNSCATIPSATASTYTLTPADVDATLRVTVTATNAVGDADATSAPTVVVAPDPPVNTVLPVVTGTARDGQALSADDGTWTGTPTIAYTRQWLRCDGGGNSCSPVAGETGSTLALAAGDVGSTFRVRVTATNAGGDAEATSAPTVVVVPDPPVNTVLPVIAGTVRDGETLSADTGTWTGTPTISYTRRWLRCDETGDACSPIAGATNTTYDATADDVGSTLRVEVTAANAAAVVAATSDPTAIVTAAPPSASADPSITGTTTDGETLTAHEGTWTGTPVITYSYQWRRCDATGGACTDIDGATAVTHDLTPADIGSRLRVVVTAENAAGPASATSPATAVIAAIPPQNTVVPAISGTPTDGQALTATAGTWTGSPTITYAYQWLRCDGAGDACAEIPGETEASYDLVTGDIASTFRVRVTASNAGGNVPATSAPTAVVSAAPPVAGTPPAISGTPREDSRLTADEGTWGGSAPVTTTHQWQRCSAAGTGCVDIPGATGGTHDLTAADVGFTIRVVVTATNASGSLSAPSAVTAVIEAAPKPEPKPDPPADVAPSSAPPAPGADDLGTIDGGLLTGAQCRQVVTGLGFRRLNAPGVGAIRLRMKADGAVAPDAPLGLALTAPARKIRAVTLTLDGRALRTTGRRGRWTAAVAPKAFADGDTHTLLITVKPRKGAARTMTETIRTANCATRYTAGQWRTKVGTGLRLRVDSRTALSSVSFPLPAALAGRGTLKPRKGLGRLRFVQAGGVRTLLQLGAAKAAAGVLLATSAAGSPSVTVTVRGRTVVVSGLPAGTGIVEVTLYRTGARLLKAKPRMKASVTGSNGAPATLNTKLQRVTGR